MFIDLFKMLEGACMFDSGNTGGGGAGTEPDPKDGNEGDKGANKEGDTITLTKEELETKLNQKFAEGARKAQEGKLENGKIEDPKQTIEPTKTQEPVASTNNDIEDIKGELASLRAEKIALKLGVNPSFTEDLVALCRGKGLELIEENMKKEVEKHSEWLLQNSGESGSGIKPLGATGGSQTKDKASEKDEARKLFGLE